MWGLGLRVWGLGCWLEGLGCGVFRGSSFRVFRLDHWSGFKVVGVYGLGLGVQGLGFQAQGLMV